TASPTRAAWRSSSNPSPTGASTPCSRPEGLPPRPEVPRSPAPAARPGRQARHRTDAHPRSAQHDHHIRAIKPCKPPDQLPSIDVTKSPDLSHSLSLTLTNGPTRTITVGRTWNAIETPREPPGRDDEQAVRVDLES